ncbi:hypothetical protein HDC90_001522 [Pedobacter sp. AK013]|uniref:hypothetical protein n=1 Tax=Pedobacter sp. AK013 TaxID=2723071 RepID=UPI001622FB42|nr:hypothetical protein [Pedobacter sp. AK013]MBB6236905.1 hypothetical protein [Pedobacter sp. AK013]
MNKLLVKSSGSKGILDDDYTLYADGTVLHEYDRHSYPGGQNLTELLTISDLSVLIKERLYKASSEENKSYIRKLLELDDLNTSL